jgi:hypothetical protein
MSNQRTGANDANLGRPLAPQGGMSHQQYQNYQQGYKNGKS